MNRQLAGLAVATTVVLSFCVSVAGATATKTSDGAGQCVEYTSPLPLNQMSGFADYADSNGDCHVTYWEFLKAASSLSVPIY